MVEVPKPVLPTEPENINRKRVRFRATYIRRQGRMSWSKCSAKDRDIICKKLRFWGRRPLHEFKTGSAKPRKWKEKLPSPPKELSEDIRDNLADYFKINQKIRVFGYLKERDFFVIWVETGHKHSK